MSHRGLQISQEKMRAAGVPEVAITVFSRHYAALEAGATGLIHEDDLAPVVDIAHLDDLGVDEGSARDALARTVIIKLNGGLATSMGMAHAKTLLPVRGDQTFMDLIVAQIQNVRRTFDVPLPLLLMNSYRTEAESLAALARHPDIAVAGLPLSFVQNREPRLLADSLEPVAWPAAPQMEWCPPGHGDLYAAIQSSGILAALLEQDFRYASVSNADNLGAAPSPVLAAWFAGTGAAYAAEVCPRTQADLKGGHLAIRRRDGHLVLREIAQSSPEDMVHFTDPNRHRYFNTNNLWLDLVQLEATLREQGGDLGLPLIRNRKRVDPDDPGSPEVLQIESAMGAAVEVFDNATALVVDRSRFLPVKTTNDLLLMRSDAYDLGPDAVPRLAVAKAPLIDLDPRFFGSVKDFSARFVDGVPSLRGAQSLQVRGDWTFEKGVTVLGEARLADQGEPSRVPTGSVVGGR